ncbi:ABC transporter permease [Anaerorhabdus sp.]|uniref:ABC transporter permease n=1 Tax=Anaerorhabdus sp. TaxID=1872524 RepID=UPI002FC6552D
MKNNHKFKFDIWGIFTLAILGFYLLFLVLPLGTVLYQAVINKETGALTFNYFIKFFSKPYYSSTLWNSFKVSFCTTVLAIAIGAPLAYFFTMFKIKGKKFLQILIILASMSAPFIGAYSWILLLGRNGVVTNFFKGIGIAVPPIYGFAGILLVLVCQLFPLIFLYIQGALKNVDNSLIEASENMGCSGWRLFLKVIVPLVLPTMLAGGLLVFMRALSDFGTPMLIGEGYRTFPVLIFNEFMSEVSGDDGFASAIAIVAILVTAFIFLIQKFASNRFSFTMNAMHTIEEKQLKGTSNILVHLYSYLVIGIAIVPQCYVIYTSFKNTKGLLFTEGYSLMSYKSAFERMGNTIINTFKIPGISLILIVLFAVLIAYLVVRRRNSLTNTVDIMSMIPYIIPGSVVGIAFGITFRNKFFSIGGLALMVIALIVRRLPYTIRSSVAVLQQIPMSIEEASISLGASKLKTFFKITVPMMAGGIISGAILSWVTLISELSTAIILYTTKTKTLTISIYTEVLRGNYGIAAALSTVLTVLTVISLLAFMKISNGKDITM